MRILKWAWFVAGAALYLPLAIVAYLGGYAGQWAALLDCWLDGWRDELRRRPGTVRAVTVLVGSHVRRGAKGGEEEYDHLNDSDMDRLARAIDNLGCFATVWPRRLQWRRRDLHCKGHDGLLGLHALAPADRDAWADAIANLDGETER